MTNIYTFADLNEMNLYPCAYSMTFNVSGDKLNGILNQRSNDMAVANKALALAKSIDARLDERAKNAWRWRILYIRAMVDQKRYQALVDDPSDDPKKIVRFHYYSGDRLLDDAEAQALFLELWGYYHCVPHNGENHHTLPPSGGTKLDVVV